MNCLPQEVIQNICPVSSNCGSEYCCNCITTSSPIENIQSGRVQVSSTMFVGCMIINGVRYFDAEQLCKAYNWTYDLTVVAENNVFQFALPNVISFTDEENENVSIDIGKSMNYVNAQGINALCMNTLNNLNLQSKDEALPMNPQPFPPVVEPEEGSDS